MQGLLKIVLMVVGASLCCVPAHASSLVQLNHDVTVNQEIVRIGDLFSNAGDKAQIALFRAPEPGYSGSVPVGDVLRQAGAYGIVLPQAVSFAAVTVTRSSRFVPEAEIAVRLQAALASENAATDLHNLTIELEKGKGGLHFPEAAQGQIMLDAVSWNAVTGDFSAEIRLAGYTKAISGTAQDRVSVVVALRDLNRETVLGMEDIALEQRPRAQITGNNFLDKEELVVGKAVRRPVRAGQVLAAADVIEPELVKRAAMVTLVLRKPGMTLTARGQALKSGRRGEAIPVMNLQSKRKIEGVVTGNDEITVMLGAGALAQLNISRK